MEQELSLEGRIARLSEMVGPSGHEEAVRQEIRRQVAPFVDQVVEDPMGNLYAVRRPRGAGSGLKVMLAAHMDEVGIIVTHVDDEGFVRFAPVGGLSASVLVGQQVAFANGTVGVIGVEPLDDPKDLKVERLFVDIGATSRQDALQRVQIGDMAVYRRGASVVGRRMVGKALDDRVGCAVVVEALARLGDSSPHEVYGVFTVQEEVGARGARPAAYRVAPDVGIAVDVTASADTPKARPLPMALGKGAAIKVKDSSVISHPGLRRLLVQRARQRGIPFQMEVLDRGGTDAGPIHTSREGVPSAVVSIPTRYLHTPGEVIDLDDARAAVDLLVAVLQDEIRL